MLLLVAMMVTFPMGSMANQHTVELGTAKNFGVLAGLAITNTGRLTVLLLLMVRTTPMPSSFFRQARLLPQEAAAISCSPMGLNPVGFFGRSEVPPH